MALRFQGRGVRRVLLVALLAGLALCFSASSAQAYVYWTNEVSGTIGRANLDGTSQNPNFITGLVSPRGIAVDGAHVYWVSPGCCGSGPTIGRANLDGTGVDQRFITGASSPLGVAVDGAHVYWTNQYSAAAGIGRANLDGTSPNQRFITGINPNSVAVDSAHVYWANDSGGGVGRANLDGSSPDPTFITGANYPRAVAVDGAHVYWGNGGTVGRANLDGSSPDQKFIDNVFDPTGLAVDGAHLYWAHSRDISLGRANLDGTGVNQRFINGVGTGVAVDALGPPPEPVQGATVNAVPRNGTVSVRLPSGASVPLESLGQQIPVGSILDATKGTVRLSAATNASGGIQHGDFGGGLFDVTQGRKNPLTTLSMTGGGLESCGKPPPGGSPKVAFARKRRRLFSNVKGHFRVRGRNSAATVRGTKFTMTDSCAGTLTHVTAGTVLVRDFSRRHNVSVKAGHSYLARPAR